MKQYDAVIIGAGVTGSAVARELSRRKGNFLVLEKESDVCEGTSKANSAIIHAGFDAEPGTIKAKMNVQGNAMMDRISRELDIPFKRVGALVTCLDEADLPHLEELYRRGEANGVPGIRLLNGEEAREIEPNLQETVCGALLAETSGIVCPFEMTLGFAENAAQNGVEFCFNTAVTSIEKKEKNWVLHTDAGDVETKVVVNAAGVHADELHNQVCEEKLEITPRRGEYMLLDKSAGAHVSRTVFQLPGAYGKGVLVSPTVHGNLLVGPTAADSDEKENNSTTAEGLAEVGEKSALAVKNIPLRQVITSFTGLRAHERGDDFVLGESAEGFFDAAGIESPGLSSAPAVGVYLAEKIAEKLNLPEKPDFDPIRKGVVKIAALPVEERQKKIEENPAYGAIVCRCEEISEGEILDAIHSTLGAKTLDGVKRRTRAGMGRCQSGFCSPRVMELLARELPADMREIRKNGKGSEIVFEKIR
ncbi:MAG: NAD(P)/FAD-dependent oxidoreductase [Acutalibacter sp.]|nr:NAD(P)/FAD-dependent oxidoreductase [Acutalibacter sp.]